MTYNVFGGTLYLALSIYSNVTLPLHRHFKATGPFHPSWRPFIPLSPPPSRRGFGVVCAGSLWMWRFHISTLGKLLTHATVTERYNLVLTKGLWCTAAGTVASSLVKTHFDSFRHILSRGVCGRDEISSAQGQKSKSHHF